MQARNVFRRVGFILAITFCISTQTMVQAEEPSSNMLTEQAVTLFKQGKFSEAQAVEDQAIKADPRSCFAHATKSYLYWQEGNVPDSIAEGQKAVLFGPHNGPALINLGHIYQMLGGYRDAIPLYAEASKADPKDWVSRICLARCYIGADRLTDGLAVLKEMSNIDSDSFAWHYQLGVSYLIIGDAAAAIQPLKNAVRLAQTDEMRSASQDQLLVALLRDNKVDDARQLEQQVISHSKDNETYVRAAAALLSAEDPAAAKQLLTAAVNNLDDTRNSDAFFRLGRIFEARASLAGAGTASTSGAWLDCAAAAYEKAVELNPGAASNHLALSAVLERQGKSEDMQKQLSLAAMFDTSDPVVSFLHERAHKPIKIAAVNFKANGLTCNCQSTKLDTELRGLKGVALVNFSHLAPYAGTVLVDESVISTDAAFAHCIKSAFGDGPALKQPITFEITSQLPITTVSGAVSIAQQVQFGDVLAFPRQFDAFQPALPEQRIAARPQTQMVNSGNTIAK